MIGLVAPPVGRAHGRRKEDEWEEEDEWEDDEEEDEDWEDEWEEEDEDEEEDEPVRRRRRVASGRGGGPAPLWPLRLDGPGRGLALGFLAMLPLFVAYELSIVDDGVGVRSVAEAILTIPLRPLGPEVVGQARRGTLAVMGLIALVVFLRHVRTEGGVGLGPRLLRVVVEGVLGAVLLGPVLLAAARFAEPYVGTMVVGAPTGPAPTLSRAAFLMGGAAYEEVVFRIGALSVAWLVAKHFLHWFGVEERPARWAAIFIAVIGSSVLFAAFHLGLFTSWLGPGGESFDAAVFTWRTTAGILLAVLFFWRGVGVAAWTHAVFNLSILIGAGPNSIS